MTDISVIIVNYNTAHIIKTCITSILKQEKINYEIIVIDNASQDQSLKTLQEFKDKITLIPSKINLGFGKANNEAFKHALGKYLLLLNPDAELQNSQDLNKIYSFMKTNPQYGLVGTKIVNENQNTETKPKHYYSGEKYIKHSLKALPGTIAWVLGACMIIPKEVYKKTGGFDEDFFLYAEDADLCLRIRKLGLEIGYFPAVTIHHIGSASEHKTSKYDLTLKKHQALLTFYKKHYSEQDVKLLVKKELHKANLRIFFHKLALFFSRVLNKESRIKYHQNNIQHYQAICEVNKNISSDNKIKVTSV